MIDNETRVSCAVGSGDSSQVVFESSTWYKFDQRWFTKKSWDSRNLEIQHRLR